MKDFILDTSNLQSGGSGRIDLQNQKVMAVAGLFRKSARLPGKQSRNQHGYDRYHLFQEDNSPHEPYGQCGCGAAANHQGDLTAMSAYVRQLERDRLAHLAADIPPEKVLRERFETWFSSLPAPTRNRPFSMGELERALGTTGRYLSPVLIALGWQRRRIWSTREHYHRYWQPPSPQ